MLTTIDNANGHGQVARKAKTNNVWREINVPQPNAIKRYNMCMNGVHRSDQVLATQNVLRKCMRWWKTLFFHGIDIFHLFKEHQKQHPEIEALRRPNDYSLVNFWEELVRQLCNFPEYDLPPSFKCQPSTSYWPVSDYTYACLFTNSEAELCCLLQAGKRSEAGVFLLQRTSMW